MCHFLKCVVHAGPFSFTNIPRDRIINDVLKFYLDLGVTWGKVCILHLIHQTGSFTRVRKKVCNSHTHTNISFEQLIPMSQRLVTSEASVLCFICVYSFPVCALWLVSAETSSAGESISRLTPVFQIIAWNEIKCLSNLKIWCSNHSWWYNQSEHVNLVHQEIF